MTIYANGTGGGSDTYDMHGNPITQAQRETMPDSQWRDAVPGVDDRIQGNLRTPSAGLYGQVPGMAGVEEDRYGALAGAADIRQAPTLNLGQANQDRNLSNASRDSSQDALAIARNQAYGGVTPAQQQYAQGITNAQNAQTALAASARGPGFGSAAYNAAVANAGIAQQGNLGLQALRANEMAAGRQAYGQTALGMRNQDLEQRGQSQQQAYQDAQDQLRQEQLNDARNQAYAGMRQQVFFDQDRNAQWAENQNSNAYYGLISNDAANRQMDLQNTNQAVTTAANTASGLLSTGADWQQQQNRQNQQQTNPNPYGNT